jgi:hypothetical protein
LGVEENRAAIQVLRDLEEGFLRRIPILRERDPENLMEEIAALNIVLELKSRLEAG